MGTILPGADRRQSFLEDTVRSEFSAVLFYEALKLFGARLIDWGRALSLLTNTTSSRSGAETRWAFRDSQPAARLPLRLAYRFVPRRGFVWPRQVSRPATQTLSRNLHYQTFTSLDFWPALISSFNTQRIRESGVAEQVGVRCQTFALIRDNLPKVYPLSRTRTHFLLT